ncbi:phage associated protein [Caudoviricetes sp.]|nr:phage associated protein [Caudoviricetes sp.]
MSLIVSDSGGDFKRVPVGVFSARCFSVIDLGTQIVEFNGETKHQRKVQLGWELYGEDDQGNPLTTDDGEPMSISKRYTLSLSEKSKLRPDLEAWRGKPFTEVELKGFDLQDLLGAPCFLNVTHTEKNGKTYSNVASITPLPRQMRDALPHQINSSRIYTITDGKNEVYQSLYEKLRATIDKAVEWQGLSAKASSPVGGVSDFESDIPFAHHGKNGADVSWRSL